MAIDPRTFFVVPCEKGQKISADPAKKDFFGELGKIGDLEILNDIGYGKVAEGLRTLTKVSNSIRTGDSDPSVMGDSANGANTVLSTVGISPGAANQASGLNPGVANVAYSQAKVIYDKVVQGNFELSDIPEYFSDLQNLSTLIGGIFMDPVHESRDFEMCGASPYATDLISFAPKYKFLFVIQLEFTEPYASHFKDIQAAFVVKNSTRPNINFDYEEVNMYNFWTRVPKRTIYEPMTMKFYDDNKNQAMTLYNAYLRAMSPISNLPFYQKMEDVRGIFESNSMDFNKINKGETTPGPASTHSYAASYGPTAGPDTMNIFKRITLFHVYNSGKLMNVYKFYNPKILTMELDELDMADNGNGNEISFQFAYDGLNIETGYPVNDTSTYNISHLSGGSFGATYPLRYIGDEEAFNNSDPDQPNAQQGFVSSVTSSVAGAIDSGRAIVSDAFNATNDYLGSVFL